MGIRETYSINRETKGRIGGKGRTGETMEDKGRETEYKGVQRKNRQLKGNKVIGT